jgi:HK97 family phage prohead protease
MSIERRIIRGTSVRALSSGDALSIEGTAAPFRKYAQLKGFKETIAPGAFRGWLKRSADGTAGVDTACLFNHDPSQVLGRFSNRTLSAEEVSSGLNYRCLLPDTSFARDLHASIARRDVTGCSFGFACDPSGSDEDWDEMDDDEADDGMRSRRSGRVIRRTIRNFKMVTDIGPVTFPAYTSGTEVNSRSLFTVEAIPEGCPVEFRALLMAARGEDVDRANFAKRRRDLMNQVIS